LIHWPPARRLLPKRHSGAHSKFRVHAPLPETGVSRGFWMAVHKDISHQRCGGRPAPDLQLEGISTTKLPD
jgi:hypothetical protein